MPLQKTRPTQSLCLRAVKSKDNIQAIKMMVRWLLGMKNNHSKSGTSTLRLLTTILHSDGDLTEQGKISTAMAQTLSSHRRWRSELSVPLAQSATPATPSPAPPRLLANRGHGEDMSRLRLAAGSAIVKLAQEPCYHEIITLEQYQLCALAINTRGLLHEIRARSLALTAMEACLGPRSPGFIQKDECYQVRQVFAQKLHKGLSRLRLPLEYMAICALCAKDPVKERRAHARQCLVKNINVRREYLKQHAAVSEKLYLFYQNMLFHIQFTFGNMTQKYVKQAVATAVRPTCLTPPAPQQPRPLLFRPCLTPPAPQQLRPLLFRPCLPLQPLKQPLLLLIRPSPSAGLRRPPMLRVQPPPVWWTRYGIPTLFFFIRKKEWSNLITECLWFVLEILMAKNENNSHAFIRKMVENIKQTKDAQGPDDAKMNEKLYTVCDVAMNIIMSKSTTYSLESPKDPVLPARFFTQPDKNFSNTKNYLPPEMKSFFTPGKPKATNVLGAVNKPLSSAGKQSQTKSSRMETVSNSSSSSNPSSPGRIKGRLDSSEMDHSENEDYTMSSPLSGKKSDKRDDSDLVRAWPFLNLKPPPYGGWSDLCAVEVPRTQSELDKPRSRKKTPATDSEEKLGMDDLTKLVQEQKPKGSQRGRKRGHTTSESDEPQWPEEKRLKEDLLENEDEQNSPPKKGKRGRPPKPLVGGGTTKEEPTMKTSKKGSKKKSGPSVVEEEEEEERQSGNTEQKSKSKQHRTSKRAQQNRAESPETSAVESTQSIPQKGRGRPSKTPSPSQQKKNVRAGRSKQAATKENDSSEEVDVFQGCSPVNDDIPQEETEEEEVSTVN
ncbi:hypothetical protein QTO34_016960, partial [Cnephaeus nilssonii]